MPAGSHASLFEDGAAYEATLGTGHQHYIRVKARLLRRLLRRHQPEAKTLVDLGCGTGEMAEALEAGAYQVTGVDLSKGMTDLARSKHIPNARFVTADAAATGLPTGSFDAAFATALYHHVEPPERLRVAREMARLVAPGGMAYVFEHNPANPITRRMVRSCPVDEGVTLLLRAEMEATMRAAGFEVAAAQYLLFFPRPLAWLAPLERALGWCPAGGQYVVVARKPGPRRSP